MIKYLSVFVFFPWKAYHLKTSGGDWRIALHWVKVRSCIANISLPNLDGSVYGERAHLSTSSTTNFGTVMNTGSPWRCQASVWRIGQQVQKRNLPPKTFFSYIFMSKIFSHCINATNVDANLGNHMHAVCGLIRGAQLPQVGVIMSLLLPAPNTKSKAACGHSFVF